VAKEVKEGKNEKGEKDERGEGNGEGEGSIGDSEEKKAQKGWFCS
jgi:hypothetical protein